MSTRPTMSCRELVALVVATAAGCAAAVGRPGAFDQGWEAERARQLAWLSETLDLDEL